MIEELKNNAKYCWLIQEEDVDLNKMIPQLSTNEYDRLSKEGFNFNALKWKKIKKHPSLDGTDLSVWQGKSTDKLVVSIYDKIKDLKIKYQFASSSDRIYWKRRVVNIQKRILLLLQHVRK